jgi:hypothetical protein
MEMGRDAPTRFEPIKDGNLVCSFAGSYGCGPTRPQNDRFPLIPDFPRIVLTTHQKVPSTSSLIVSACGPRHFGLANY